MGVLLGPAEKFEGGLVKGSNSLLEVVEDLEAGPPAVAVTHDEVLQAVKVEYGLPRFRVSRYFGFESVALPKGLGAGLVFGDEPVGCNGLEL